jgi:uncharacterized membrane protein
MEKERAQVTYLLVALVFLTMLILILNRLAVPTLIIVLAILLLIVLAVVTLVLIWRIRQRTKGEK